MIPGGSSDGGPSMSDGRREHIFQGHTYFAFVTVLSLAVGYYIGFIDPAALTEINSRSDLAILAPLIHIALTTYLLYEHGNPTAIPLTAITNTILTAAPIVTAVVLAALGAETTTLIALTALIGGVALIVQLLPLFILIVYID